MTLPKKINVAFMLAAVFIFITSCNKHVHYSGIVLSRHLIPMPNVRVTITVGHGEHTGGGGSALEGSTDNDGKFKINATLCNNCWGSAISVNTADSGSVEHQKIDNSSDIQLILK